MVHANEHDLLCFNRADCIERIHVFKLLGVLINSSLKWNDHVNFICSKASSRLYFLKLLKRSGVDIPDLLLYYNSVIVPVLLQLEAFLAESGLFTEYLLSLPVLLSAATACTIVLRLQCDETTVRQKLSVRFG